MFTYDDDMVECPYNSSHRMLRKRLQSHLFKCRLQHKGAELRKCPFNILHLIPEPEFAHHAKNCPDRKLITQYKYDAPERKEEEVPKHAPVECDENWDDTLVNDYNPRLNLERAKVLLQPDGANPSERKRFIKKERKRLGDEDSSSDDSSNNISTSSRHKRQKYDRNGDYCEYRYGGVYPNRYTGPRHDRSISPSTFYSSRQRSRSPISKYASSSGRDSPTGWRRSREYSPPERRSPSYPNSYTLPSYSRFDAAQDYYLRISGRIPNNYQYNSGRDAYYSYPPLRDYSRTIYVMPEAPPAPLISYPRPRSYSPKDPYLSFSER